MRPSPSLTGILALVGLMACHDGARRGSDPAPVRAEPVAAQDDDAGASGCAPLPFAQDVALPEASGAVYLPGPPATVLVISDSGNRGQYAELDATSGAVVSRGRLPLDGGASDDLEGLSVAGDRFYGLTSSGYLREWERAGSREFRLVRGAYPLAEPGDGSPPLSCKHAGKVNCGANFEGLCLAEAPSGRCVGWAAAKANGTLYCLIRGQDGRLAADRSRAVKVAGHGRVSGCSILPGGDLLVGTNLFGGNAVYRVTGAGGDHPEIRLMDRLGPGFGEAVVAGPNGVVYRFSDMGGSPSMMARYQCPR